jgi:phage repressor protein C with HTH and peptisase S24 domain
MNQVATTVLCREQQFCAREGYQFFVRPNGMDVADAAKLLKRRRAERGWSAEEMAARARAFANEEGSEIKLSQQLISKFESGGAKRMPQWIRYAWRALDAAAEETAEDPHLHLGKTDTSVMIRLLPNFVGLGVGGTGEGDEGRIAFSRDLVENELRVPVDSLLAMVAEGNSMEPDFRGGDQILVDTRRKSLAQPGAFCLWDGDGHVVKFLERIPGTDPVRVRVISANSIYEPTERLLDEINLVGRVIWFGRRVQ